ncbi:hypothetical protein [Kibdelosporangium aridum]|uniref:hypothetical protein n=1 Tax=Kibdelosporangium aridum TaxID=2030 RepID=UPI0005269CFC
MVTNLVTDEWSLGLGITLVVLVVCAVVIGMSTALGGGGDAQGVQQRAKASGNSAISQAGR